MRDQTAIHIHAPALPVHHQDLVRVGDSAHKSECPRCDGGVLPMQRLAHNHLLLNTDRCLLCGQAVVYTDVPNAARFDLAYRQPNLN